ncbi:hypothetical protein BGY98DRAFT_329548 [Russula aff. rugulosa BPL654]|nr:hypothetical protein BGY98DRAFT_329548 [Russula aff. rugulosa BPL654]
MHVFHASHSNAKKGCLPPFVTGGSWKKSPVTTSYTASSSSLIDTVIRSTSTYLDATEWPVSLLPQSSSNLTYFFKQMPIHHRHYNQNVNSLGHTQRKVAVPSSIMRI